MTDTLAGYTKLMLLIEEGDLEGMRDLLNRGTDINAQNKSGHTALGIAAKNGITPAVVTLLEYGADVNSKNKFGQTALFTACSQNFDDIVKILIENRGDVNIKDTRGWTPLMIACHHGHINIVKILLHHGADIIAEDSFGKTAINRTKSPEIYQLLTYYAHKELEKYNSNQQEQHQRQNTSRQLQEDRQQQQQIEEPQNEQSIGRSSALSPGSQGPFKGNSKSQFNTEGSLYKSSASLKQKKSINESPKAHPYSYKKIKHILELDTRRADQSIHPATILPHQKQEAILRQKKDQKEREQISQMRQSKRGSPFHRSRVDSPSPKRLNQENYDTRDTNNRIRYKAPEAFEDHINTPKQQSQRNTKSTPMTQRAQSPPQNYSQINNKHTSKLFLKEQVNNLNMKESREQSSPEGYRQVELAVTHKVRPQSKQTGQLPNNANGQNISNPLTKTKVHKQQQKPQFQAPQSRGLIEETYQRNDGRGQNTQVKQSLNQYIGNYSGLVQDYVRQKLSVALAFELRRNFASIKQELMTELMQSVVILHRDLINSFSSAANMSPASLNTSLNNLNEDINTIIESFETKMLSASNEQEQLEILFQRNQELDALLVREVDDRYTQEEKKSTDKSEQELLNFLKLETNLHVGNIFGVVNETLEEEFGNNDSQFKELIQSSMKSMIGQVCVSIKKNLCQRAIQEEDEQSGDDFETQDNQHRDFQHPYNQNQSSNRQGHPHVEQTQNEDDEQNNQNYNDNNADDNELNDDAHNDHHQHHIQSNGHHFQQYQQEQHQPQHEHQNRHYQHNVQHVGYMFIQETPLQPIQPLGLNTNVFWNQSNNLESNAKVMDQLKGAKSINHQIIQDTTKLARELAECNLPNGSYSVDLTSLKELHDLNDKTAEHQKAQMTPNTKSAASLKNSPVQSKDGLENIEQLNKNLENVLSRKSSQLSLHSRKPISGHKKERLSLLHGMGYPNESDFSCSRDVMSFRDLEKQEALLKLSEKKCSNNENDRALYSSNDNVSIYRRDEKQIICPPINHDSNVENVYQSNERDVVLSFESVETSIKITDQEESCILTETEESDQETCMDIMPSKELCTYPVHVQELSESDEVETPHKLSIHQHEQTAHEKMSFTNQEASIMNIHKESLKEDQDDLVQEPRTELSNLIPLRRDSEIYRQNVSPRGVLAEPAKEISSHSLILTPKQTPLLFKPTSSTQVKSRNILSLDQSNLNKNASQAFAIANDKKDQQSKLAQSIIISSNPSLKSPSAASTLSNLSLNVKIANSLSEDSSICGSDDNRSRQILAKSLIMENSNLTRDISSALRKSNRLQLEYILNREQELKKSKAESASSLKP